MNLLPLASTFFHPLPIRCYHLRPSNNHLPFSIPFSPYEYFLTLAPPLHYLNRRHFPQSLKTDPLLPLSHPDHLLLNSHLPLLTMTKIILPHLPPVLRVHRRNSGSSSPPFTARKFRIYRSYPRFSSAPRSFTPQYLFRRPVWYKSRRSQTPSHQ